MEERHIVELYRIIKNAYEDSSWDSVKEALEYIVDFMDTDEDEISDGLN